MDTHPVTDASHADAPDARQLIIRKHLEQALNESTDPEARFYIRQALQFAV